MKAVFIRHGESTGNAGIPSHDLSAIELTRFGHEQARDIAASWAETPTLIVTSPMLRTQQTAAPTIARFPDVPVEIWPIEEFTYLQPSRWNGTSSTERMPHVERYWANADPDYCDGAGAESFATLLRRAETALSRIAARHPASGSVYVFSHGQFIQAVRAIVEEAELNARGKMLQFWRKGEPPKISNGEKVEFSWSGAGWTLRTGEPTRLDAATLE